MSLRTNYFILWVRRFLRKAGLNKWVSQCIYKEKEYEKKFFEQIVTKITPGDCFWDVGANVGYYTKRIADLVGQTGLVVAFEPDMRNFRRLSQEVTFYANVKPLPYALGNFNGKVYLKQGKDVLGATSRICEDSEGLVVDIFRGDSLVNDGIIMPPNAIKIDCEGYEYEVLEGLSGLMKFPGLKLIGIEVHFGILDERKTSGSPVNIEKFLLNYGFIISWTDWNHIIAFKEKK